MCLRSNNFLVSKNIQILIFSCCTLERRALLLLISSQIFFPPLHAKFLNFSLCLIDTKKHLQLYNTFGSAILLKMLLLLPQHTVVATAGASHCQQQRNNNRNCKRRFYIMNIAARALSSEIHLLINFLAILPRRGSRKECKKAKSKLSVRSIKLGQKA